MKNLIFTSIALAGTMLVLSACKNDSSSKEPQTSLKVTPMELSFGKEGGNKDLALNVSNPWKAEVDAEWCTLSQYSGDKDAFITVTVQASTTKSATTATIKFSDTKGNTATATVKREGALYTEDVNQWYTDMEKMNSFIGKDTIVALQYFRERGMVFSYKDGVIGMLMAGDVRKNNESCSIYFNDDGKVRLVDLFKVYDNQKNKAKSICIQVHDKFIEFIKKHKCEDEYEGMLYKSFNFDEDHIIYFYDASDFEKYVNSYDTYILSLVGGEYGNYSSFVAGQFANWDSEERIHVAYGVGGN